MQGVVMNNKLKVTTRKAEFVNSCLKVSELSDDSVEDLKLPEGKSIAELLHEEESEEENTENTEDENK